ncbi:flagella assembly protein FlgT middle domain-containing protein [Alishewanella longhuensis]
MQSTLSQCVVAKSNTLQARQDAIYGQLFQLGEHSSRQLAAHLTDWPFLLLQNHTQPLFPEQLDFAAAEQFFEQGQQFILLANIYDLSLGDKASKKFWQSSLRERFFALDVKLYDTFERRVTPTRVSHQ